jgi:transposase
MLNKQKPDSSKHPAAVSASHEKRTRRKIDDALKTKVVLEALKEAEPLAVIASRYEVHPNQIAQWRKQFLGNAQTAFSGDKKAELELERIRNERDDYARKVGELTMDVEFLKKNLRKLGLL